MQSFETAGLTKGQWLRNHCSLAAGNGGSVASLWRIVKFGIRCLETAAAEQRRLENALKGGGTNA